MNVAHTSLHQKNSHAWSFGGVLTALSPMLLSLLMVAAISGCNRAQSAPVQEAPKVTVAPVLERNITEWDEFTGRLDAVEKVEVRPRVSGYIERVAFTEGKEVAAGTLLFQIDPRPYQAILDQARAEEERVRTRSVLAKQEVERAEKMLAKRAISQEEMDERLNALRESESGIDSAKAAVEQAVTRLKETMHGDDATRIRQATQRLAEASARIGQATQQATGHGSGSAAGADQSDVIDAEFKEVDDQDRKAS